MIALNLDGGLFHHVSNGVLLKGDFSDATLNNRLTVPFLGGIRLPRYHPHW